jgi:uncharacterized protein (TIGR02145 family)
MKTKKMVLCMAAACLTFGAPAQNNNQQDSPTFDKGVSINGVVWATRNVDKPGTFAATPGSPGMLYQWNSKVAWSTTELPASESARKLWFAIPESSAWAAAQDPCPKGWRIPTDKELAELSKASSLYVSATPANWDVEGYWFGDDAASASSSSHAIFIPYTPSLTTVADKIVFEQPGIAYWSSTLSEHDYTTYLGVHRQQAFLGAWRIPFRPASPAYALRCVAK